MSNIASRIRIEPIRPDVTARFIDALPTLVAGALLAVLLVSLSPFQSGNLTVEATSANRVNQIGFALIGSVSLFSMMIWCDPRVLWKLVTPGWLVFIALVAVSILYSPDRGAALRGFGFSFAALFGIIAVLTVPRDAEGFGKALAIGAAAVVGLSYYGIVALPGAAIHGFEGIEPQHAGLWRGIYTHKNITGPMMAMLAFCGIYLWRARRWPIGILIAVSATLFMFQTGSKTSMGTAFAVFLIVWLAGAMGMRGLGAVLAFVFFVGFALATNGMVLFDWVADAMEKIAPGNSYTGRVSLWAYAVEKIAERPWTGFGFDTLWGRPPIMEAERPYDAAWDFRGVVNSHSSYFDLALDMGLPALGVLMWIAIFKPMLDFARTRRLRENALLADLFMMIVLFAALNGFMEAFFMRRAHPVWLMLALGLFGLHFTARIAVPTRRALRPGD